MRDSNSDPWDCETPLYQVEINRLTEENERLRRELEQWTTDRHLAQGEPRMSKNEGYSAPANGGPAFPDDSRADYTGGRVCLQYMRLRDWFAGLAMQGMLAEAAHPEHLGFGLKDFPSLAEEAFDLADAMLKARERGPRGTA
jgi:hypothetical protein